MSFLFFVIGFGLGFFVNWKYGDAMILEFNELKARAKAKVKEWLN